MVPGAGDAEENKPSPCPGGRRSAGDRSGAGLRQRGAKRAAATRDSGDHWEVEGGTGSGQAVQAGFRRRGTAKLRSKGDVRVSEKDSMEEK